MICNYLHDKEIQYCQVFLEGVFMPTLGHLDHFCRSAKCVECFQFMKSQEHLAQSKEKLRSSRNKTRRQCMRFSQKWQLFISEENLETSDSKILENLAQTIDISSRGFRIISRKKLTPSQLVSFSFADTLAAPFSTGLGEVRWTIPHGSIGGFHSGLALVLAPLV